MRRNRCPVAFRRDQIANMGNALETPQRRVSDPEHARRERANRTCTRTAQRGERRHLRRRRFRNQRRQRDDRPLRHRRSARLQPGGGRKHPHRRPLHGRNRHRQSAHPVGVDCPRGPVGARLCLSGADRDRGAVDPPRRDRARSLNGWLCRPEPERHRFGRAASDWSAFRDRRRRLVQQVYRLPGW